MNNIQVTVTAQGKGKTKTANILLEGELILRHLQEAAEEIKRAVGNSDNIHVELKNIVNIDLACIQLLISARLTAVAAQKTFICQMELPEEVKNMMAHAGLAQLPALLNDKLI
jgi:ABC-type transporter Mla MlaB component